MHFEEDSLILSGNLGEKENEAIRELAEKLSKAMDLCYSSAIELICSFNQFGISAGAAKEFAERLSKLLQDFKIDRRTDRYPNDWFSNPFKSEKYRSSKNGVSLAMSRFKMFRMPGSYGMRYRWQKRKRLDKINLQTA